MGFLAAYEGTERIDLGRGFWADVKKCLSTAEMGHVEATMGSGRQKVDVSNGGRQFAELDIRASWLELVVQSLVEWNLTEDDDRTVWPLDAGSHPVKPGDNPYPRGCPRRRSVNRLPDPVFKQIWKVCDELNSPQQGAEAASFPEQDELGDPDGDAGASDPGAVPDRTGAVAAVRADEGDGGSAPAP